MKQNKFRIILAAGMLVVFFTVMALISVWNLSQMSQDVALILVGYVALLGISWYIFPKIEIKVDKTSFVVAKGFFYIVTFLLFLVLLQAKSAT